jgi:hypothetical protein
MPVRERGEQVSILIDSPRFFSKKSLARKVGMQEDAISGE